ncbi:MAG: hypothetical protein HQM16_02360 [Deltaproteobacteria bacterium]|nr:hypothetical protein [Deltaproteobacteria bacterium]
MLNDISSTSSTSKTGMYQGTTGGDDIEETKMQFLTLLLAQLKNQDPLSPTDTDQMTQQMMSLGQLEQLFDLNKNVEGLVNITAGSQIATYSSMVGKSALAKGNTFELKGENKGSLNFEIAHVPETATIRVFDKFNNLVSEFSPQIESAGMQQIPFGGLGMDNKPLEDGYYAYTVEAYNDVGDAIPVNTYSVGTINSIRLEGGVPVFAIGKDDFGITDIQRIF